MGVKWAFPIFCRLNASQAYSFEDIVRLTHRNVHRASMSKILKEFISLGIISKKDGRYKLTKKGINIQKECLQIGRNIISPKECSTLNNPLVNDKS
jgi:DNA-binding HxlR family transcriptional regulator